MVYTHIRKCPTYVHVQFVMDDSVVCMLEQLLLDVSLIEWLCRYHKCVHIASNVKRCTVYSEQQMASKNYPIASKKV